MPEIIAFLSGFIIALFADPLRQWLFRANVTLEFINAEHFVTRTKETIKGRDTPPYEASYVRIKATNRSPRLAKNCRAYLVNIEQFGRSGDWESTDYCESMQLAWSARGDGGYIALDLPAQVPHFIDVVSTRETSTQFLPAIDPILQRYLTLLKSTGTFRFTVLLSGENVRPVQIRLSFKWTGKWDEFEVSVA
jgi:hypothetical protein